MWEGNKVGEWLCSRGGVVSSAGGEALAGARLLEREWVGGVGFSGEEGVLAGACDVGRSLERIDR